MGAACCKCLQQKPAATPAAQSREKIQEPQHPEEYDTPQYGNGLPLDTRLRLISKEAGLVLYEGWFFKKPQGGGKSAKGAPEWERRYVRVFPGKIEWYKDESASALAKPKGWAPLGVFEMHTSPPTFRRIFKTMVSVESSSPPKHKHCLRLAFSSDSGEVKYRKGKGAHHAEYVWCPDAQPDVAKLEAACVAACDVRDTWDDAAYAAIVDALKHSKNPINGALSAKVKK